jgi:hypothetical protein
VAAVGIFCSVDWSKRGAADYGSGSVSEWAGIPLSVLEADGRVSGHDGVVSGLQLRLVALGAGFQRLVGSLTVWLEKMASPWTV